MLIYLQGTVIGVCVSDNSTDYNSILVQGVLTKGNQQGNVSVRISNKTQIFQQDGNKLDNTSFENIKPGQSVNITFIGPIIQEYPPQATGNQVIITE